MHVFKWVLTILPAITLALTSPVAAQVPDASDPIAVVDGLAGPESVHYDPTRDVYYVGNFNGEAAGDANGFVSRLSPDGVVLAREFLVGTPAHPLHGPRGMRLVEDRLWVVDADGLHAFDPDSGAHLSFVDFREFEPGFLNDVVAAPDGALIVTDTGGDGRVYRVENGEIGVLLDGQLQGPPNGVARLPDGALVFAPWGGGRVLEALRLGQTEPFELGSLPGGGRLDGIEPWKGGLLIASQDDQAIWLWHPDGSRRLMNTPGRPADIGVDTRRNRIAVPYIALDRVDIRALPD